MNCLIKKKDLIKLIKVTFYPGKLILVTLDMFFILLIYHLINVFFYNIQFF